MTVYLDSLFMLNFLMDSIIIGMTFFLTRRFFSIGKIALSSAGMALYGCGMFVSEFAWFYWWPLRILTTLFFVWIVFRGRTVGTFLKDGCVFLFSSFLLVGSVYGLASILSYQNQLQILLNGNTIYIDMHTPFLIAGIGIAYAFLWMLKKIYIHNFSRDKVLLTISITMEEYTKEFVVLLDTGCTAADPLTGRPLLVLGKEGEMFLSKCFLELPYAYAGGMARMKGFYPDSVFITKGAYTLCEKICVGIGNTDFYGMPYQGVLNPDAVCAVENQNSGKGEKKIEIQKERVSA